MQLEFTELLIGIAEIAVALAGFSGVVVVLVVVMQGRGIRETGCDWDF
ncbi:MAG: hypothetical protein QGF90_08855 [Gammaproteobacteria bacterium]|jgi:hypothetical protein|nr:hypothetical protein [Gammaproteobacteria bacterium]|tara:strand:- start:220 stop:363 length:144 start_codon:yes stop_codon:yes gene_type:complete